MVSKRISELPAAGALDGSEQIPLTQSGETRRITSDTYPKRRVEDVVANHGADPAFDSGDDLTAFEAAISAGDVVYVPAGFYNVSNGFTVPQGVEFKMHSDARITIGQNATDPIVLETDFATHVIGLIWRDWSDDQWNNGNDAGESVGVRLRNAKYNLIFIHEIRRFTTGLDFHGDGDGTTDNTIIISGKLWQNKKSLIASTINSGWANENNVYGGVLRNNAATTGTASNAGTRLIDLGTANGWAFYGTNLEGDHSEYTIDLDGDANLFSGCRYERIQDGRIRLGSNSEGNSFVGGIHLKRSLLADSGTNNVVIAPNDGDASYAYQDVTQPAPTIRKARWVVPFFAGTASDFSWPAGDRAFYAPVLLTNELQTIALEIVTGVTDAVLELGIYDYATNGEPGDRLAVTSQLAAGSAGVASESITFAVSSPRWVLLAAWSDAQITAAGLTGPVWGLQSMAALSIDGSFGAGFEERNLTGGLPATATVEPGLRTGAPLTGVRLA